MEKKMKKGGKAFCEQLPLGNQVYSAPVVPGLQLWPRKREMSIDMDLDLSLR